MSLPILSTELEVRIYRFLEENRGVWLSTGVIARSIGVNRNSVYKALERMRARGIVAKKKNNRHTVWTLPF